MRQQQQLSQQDWQLLSAYLDGQLSANDQAKLEKRLREQAGLRGALEELKTTRAMLRGAGKQRVPRNFTLTAAMVEKARPHPLLRLVPVLNFASAAAALAVVILLVVGLLPGANPAMQAASPATGPTLNAVEDTTGQPAPFIWNTAPEGLGGGSGTDASAAPETMSAKGMGGGAADAGPGFVLPPQVVTELPPVEAPAAEPAPEIQRAVPTESAGALMIPAMTATPAPAGTMVPAAPGQITPQEADQPAPTAEALRQAEEPQAPLTGSGPILGVRPPEQAQAENQQVIGTYGAVDTGAREQRSNRWIAPLVLGILAACAALASLIIRRTAAS